MEIPFYITRIDGQRITMKRSDHTAFTEGAIQHVWEGGILLRRHDCVYVKAFMNAERREPCEAQI